MSAIASVASAAILDLNAIGDVEFDILGNHTVEHILLMEGQRRTGRAVSTFRINANGQDLVATENALVLFRGEAGGAVRCWVFSSDAPECKSWLPSITFGGSDAGVTYSGRRGSLVKTGPHVHATGHIEISSKGTASGLVGVTGLPYRARPLADFWWGGSVFYTNTIARSCLIFQNTDIVRLYNGMDTLSASDLANGSQIYFSISYEAAS